MAIEGRNTAILGKRIREAREKTGLSQAELARAMGVLPTHLNRWEKGKVAPGWEYLARIAKHCNVTLDWLLTGEEPAAAGDSGMAETAEGEREGRVPFDAEQLKEVVMAVEEFLQEVEKDLSPRDKAELIARLYSVAVRGLAEETGEEGTAGARSRMTARMAAELARYGM
jgi:transcriptional regulator with XRE-family HTH domain